MAGLLAAACLAGCSSSIPPATFTRYQFTCCDGSDVQRIWHPGETLLLHWSPQSASSTDSATQMLTLTATLRGPYADVDSLKRGGMAPTTLAAASVSATTAMPSSPTSVIVLPADLPPGFYDLTEKVASASGSASGSNVVRVGPPGT
jgi:hypothetical protein